MSHDKTAGVARSISHSVMNAVEDFSEELNAKSNEEKFCYLGKRSDESLGKGSQELDEGLLETETVIFFRGRFLKFYRSSIFVKTWI